MTGQAELALAQHIETARNACKQSQALRERSAELQERINKLREQMNNNLLRFRKQVEHYKLLRATHRD